MLESSRRLIDFARTLHGDAPVPLHTPTLLGKEWDAVKACLDDGWVSSAGPVVVAFERQVAAWHGSRFAVAVINGTSGLHVALLAAGVERNDLVICPALTFVATANAIAYCGADPLFADCESDTLGLNPDALALFLDNQCAFEGGVLRRKSDGRRIRACVPVHVFGHPARIEKIVTLCRAVGVAVIEDATESLGSRTHGRACGTIADAGVLSFNGNKIVTAGGGGMVVTDDEGIASRARHLSTTARLPDRFAFVHDRIGYNYRLPSINAALGSAQFEHLDSFVAAKRRLADAYAGLFADCDGVSLRIEPAGAKSNYWLNALVFESEEARDRFVGETNAAGVETRPCWHLLPDLPIYRGMPAMDGLDVARNVSARIANIPSSSWFAAKISS